MKNFNDNSIADMRKRFGALSQQSNAASASPSKHSDKERKAELKSIRSQLKKGNHVQNRKLRTWLTDEEYETFEQQWEGQKELRNNAADKPSEITEYEARLRKGIFAENRSEGYSMRNKKGAKELAHNSQKHFESALEHLEEILSADPSLEMWFDRSLDFSPKGNLSLSGVGMPRVVTSRSLDKLGDGLLSGKMSKGEVKIDVVERALANL